MTNNRGDGVLAAQSVALRKERGGKYRRLWEAIQQAQHVKDVGHHAPRTTLSDQPVTGSVLTSFLVPALPVWNLDRVATRLVPGTLPNGKVGKKGVESSRTALDLSCGKAP